MAIVEGAGVAIVTPFKENGEISFDKLDELIEEQIAGHTDCIVSMGTTGESATTTEEEHLEVIRFTCERVKGRIPVIAGTGSNCTKTAITLSEEAEGAGADGVLLVSPYYNKATQNGLKAHFTAVANAIQSATGMDFHLESYSEHSLDEGSTSRAASYVGLAWGDGSMTWGAGTDTDIIRAGIKAMISAVNNK